MNVKEVIVGTKAIYWKVVGPKGERSGPEKTVILSEPWKVGNQMVCNILGKTGGVAISHLDTITPGSLMAAKLSGLTDISNEELEAATHKFFADRGIKADVKIGK